MNCLIKDLVSLLFLLFVLIEIYIFLLKAFFTLDEKTHYYWFNPCTLESEKEFKLLGTLFGIAIYNNVLLHVQFPPVFFRKLMGKIGTFDDLKESHEVRGIFLVFFNIQKLIF
jgi:hypothetical protein